MKSSIIDFAIATLHVDDWGIQSMETSYTVSMTAIASVVALSVIVFDATGAAKAGPIVPRGHDCLEYAEGGTDCGFTSYSQCEATASGIAAECYGSAAPDDKHLRRHFLRVGY
jgi:hypothetical protein